LVLLRGVLPAPDHGRSAHLHRRPPPAGRLPLRVRSCEERLPAVVRGRPRPGGARGLPGFLGVRRERGGGRPPPRVRCDRGGRPGERPGDRLRPREPARPAHRRRPSRARAGPASGRVRVRHRYRRTVALLAVALAASFLFAVAVGAVWISPWSTIRLLAWKLHLTARPHGVPRSTEVILFQLRLPRVVLAGVVGAALAASGAVFQGLFRNPLADPAIIGVSSGAALGAVGVIVFVGAGALGAFAVPLAAFAGALLTALLVYRLARIGPAVHVATLLLAGIAVAAVISSLMSLVMSFSGEQVRDIYAWLLGGLVGQGWS